MRNKLTLFVVENIIILEVITMNYISAQEIADKWGISKRRVQVLCASNRIKNAKKIGNMWVVPSNAAKPKDARYKGTGKTAVTTKQISPIKKARREIKAIADKMFNSIVNENYSAEDSKHISVCLFATELLTNILTQRSNTVNHKIVKNVVASTLECDIEIPDCLKEKFSGIIYKFISNNSFCIDDALAWFYQYTNKLSDNTGISSTQFFTEKYMITALVDSIDVFTVNGKILDPACGGGNFLLYCFDILAKKDISKNDSKLEVQSKMKNILSKLFGYEIDVFLAAVASFTLKIKALLTLDSYGHQIHISDFEQFEPNIFYSVNHSYIGALDCKKSEHKVCKVGNKQITTMETVFSNVDCVLTNPPFKTVKGMSD
ncbi:MAG TPA: hypothetical protein DD434_09235, partial [Bacteroidales bacterium]|nr:hypothetical protein [Bacteroidales bacterium]